MKQPRKKRLIALTDPAASSWLVVAVSYPLFLLDRLGMFGFTKPSQHETFTTLLISSLVIQLGILVFLLLAHTTWLKISFARRHPSLTLLTFLLAVIVGHIIQLFVQGIIFPTNEYYVAFEAILYQTVVLTVVAHVVVSLTKLRAREIELQTATNTLELARSEGLKMQQALRSQVLDTVVNSIENTFTVSKQSLSQLSERLRSVAAEDVRSLSHDLAFEPRMFAVYEAPREPLKWRTVWSLVGARPQLAPKLMAWVVTILGLRLTVETDVPQELASDSLTVTVEWVGLVFSLTMLAIFWFGTYFSAIAGQKVLQKLTVQRGTELSFATQSLIVLAVGASATVIAMVGIALPSRGSLTDFNFTALLAIIGPIYLTALVVGVLNAARERMTAAVAELDELTQQLRWDVSEINLVVFNDQQILARLLHGPLQSALHAAAQQIESDALLTGVENTDDTEPQSVRAKQRIKKVLEELENEYQSMPIRLGVERLVELWLGACSIEVEMSDDVAERIDADSGCSAGIIEVLTEVISNAHKHGGASEMHVSISNPSDRIIQLQIENNGTTISRKGLRETSRGYGTDLLNKFTVQWMWTSVQPPTLVAELPLRSVLVESV